LLDEQRLLFPRLRSEEARKQPLKCLRGKKKKKKNSQLFKKYLYLSLRLRIFFSCVDVRQQEQICEHSLGQAQPKKTKLKTFFVWKKFKNTIEIFFRQRTSQISAIP
jgi:hypothetical protein